MFLIWNKLWRWWQLKHLGDQTALPISLSWRTKELDQFHACCDREAPYLNFMWLTGGSVLVCCAVVIWSAVSQSAGKSIHPASHWSYLSQFVKKGSRVSFHFSFLLHYSRWCIDSSPRRYKNDSFSIFICTNSCHSTRMGKQSCCPPPFSPGSN